jgi:hypothetical protein
MFRFLGPRFRVNYWSCSKLADKIRGTSKPAIGLTSEGWEEWDNVAKSKHPVRYYIAEELLNSIQDFFYFPKDVYKVIRNYINNRYIHKTHYLKTGLKPGCYYEFDFRMLHGLFNELIDFVEIEQASMCSITNHDKSKKYKFKKGRCPEAGLDYLDWASSLTHENEPTLQAEMAKRTLKLYHWWKNRNNRPDAMDESGWSEYCDNTEFGSKTTDEGREKLNKLHELEEKYEQEDEDMMIELIKIRRSLWT